VIKYFFSKINLDKFFAI